MQLRIKILSHFLLAIYILVALHHSVAHVHTFACTDNLPSTNTHNHHKYQDVHHAHQFHVGIFHFLGHLFEDIHHTDDLADDHLHVVQNSSAKKVVDHNDSISSYIHGQHVLVLDVDAESLPDPPYHLSILHKLRFTSTPLRAPPAFV